MRIATLFALFVSGCLPMRDNPNFIAPEKTQARVDFSRTDAGSPDAGKLDEPTVHVDRHVADLPVSLRVHRTEMTNADARMLIGDDRQLRGDPADPAVVYLQTAREIANAASDRDGLSRCYEEMTPGGFLLPVLRCTGWRMPTRGEHEKLVADHDLPILGQIDERDGCYPALVDLAICYACTCPNGPMNAPASSANSLGLHDVLGNVEEWVEVAGLTERPGYGARYGGSWETSAAAIVLFENIVGRTDGNIADRAGFRLVRDDRGG